VEIVDSHITAKIDVRLEENSARTAINGITMQLCVGQTIKCMKSKLETVTVTVTVNFVLVQLIHIQRDRYLLIYRWALKVILNSLNLTQGHAVTSFLRQISNPSRSIPP
jgi:hypothetical protein